MYYLVQAEIEENMPYYTFIVEADNDEKGKEEALNTIRQDYGTIATPLNPKDLALFMPISEDDVMALPNIIKTLRV